MEESRRKKAEGSGRKLVQKRTLCRFFLKEQCERGWTCTYAHSPEELGKMVVDESLSWCRHRENCKYAREGRCRFKHEVKLQAARHENNQRAPARRRSPGRMRRSRSPEKKKPRRSPERWRRSRSPERTRSPERKKGAQSYARRRRSVESPPSLLPETTLEEEGALVAKPREKEARKSSQEDKEVASEKDPGEKQQECILPPPVVQLVDLESEDCDGPPPRSVSQGIQIQGGEKQPQQGTRIRGGEKQQVQLEEAQHEEVHQEGRPKMNLRICLMKT